MTSTEMNNMMAEAQGYASNVKQARIESDEIGEEFWANLLFTSINHIESVTGRKVVVRRWVVSFAD